MYRSICLVLLSALVAVGAKRIDINDALDRLIENLNNFESTPNRLHKWGHSRNFVRFYGKKQVKYTDAKLIGVDSLKRTSDCWQEVEGNDVYVDISYGYGMLTLVLPHLRIAGRNMSAYSRVRDNSVHVSFTTHIDGKKCNVTLNDMRVKKMENVEFGASLPEYDGANVEDFFKYVVKPKLNGIIDSYYEKIEDSLQVICRISDYITTGDFEKLVEATL